MNTSPLPALLTDAEVDAITDGYSTNAARIRYLRGLGLTVYVKPNGRPLVARAHYDAVMNPAGGIEPGRGAAPGAGASQFVWSVPA